MGIVILGCVLPWSEYSGMIPEGEHAPFFETTLSTGERFSLAEHIGKSNMVLFFYPKDFTPSCTKEVCSFRDRYSDLIELDALLIGVSSDPPESHSKFIEKYRLPFPLVSDSDKSISKAYGVARFWGLLFGPKRVTIVIDKKGIVRKVCHDELSVDNHLNEVLASLRILQDRKPL